MKINQVSPGRVEPATGVAQKRTDKAANKTSIADKTDSVHISTFSAGAQIADISNKTINTAKVAEIKQAISEGRFKVNADAVADRLLETVRDLIQNKHSN